MSEGLRKKAIPPSLTRPLLVGGAERTPAAFVCAVGAGFCALGWQLHSPIAGVTGFIVLTVGMGTLRMIAKQDPMMFKVYPRYLKYKPFYPARALPARAKSHAKTILIASTALALLFLLMLSITHTAMWGWLAFISVFAALLYSLIPERP